MVMGCDHTLTVKYMAVTIYSYGDHPYPQPFSFFFWSYYLFELASNEVASSQSLHMGQRETRNLLARSSTKEISNLILAVASSVGLEISISM